MTLQKDISQMRINVKRLAKKMKIHQGKTEPETASVDSHCFRPLSIPKGEMEQA